MKKINVFTLSTLLLSLVSFTSCSVNDPSVASVSSTGSSSVSSAEQTSTSTSSNEDSSIESSINSSEIISSSSSESSSSSIDLEETFENFHFDYPTWPSMDENTMPDQITFYSLNDVHGAIDNSAYPGMGQIDYEIKSNPSYLPSSVMISSGDMFQGSSLSNLSQGYCMTDCMNAMGFESMAIGNHEFDWSVANLEKISKRANFPFLGINIYSKTTNQRVEFIQPSKIIKRGKAKIGIIGSIDSGALNTISASMVKDIVFKEDVALVTAEAERLKLEENCDLVVVSTHQGTSGSNYFTSPYVDGVFGGHDHGAWKQVQGDGRMFLEGGCNSKYYSKMTFTLSEGKYTPSFGAYVAVTKSDTIPDGLIKDIIDKYNSVISVISDAVVGKRDGELVRAKNYATDSKYGNLGKMICDSMLHYANDTCKMDTIVASFHNVGGIRGDITNQGLTQNADKTWNITVGDLYRVSPFDNQVQYIEISGSTLYSAGKSGSYAHSSNLTISGTNAYINGEKVIKTNKYLIITIDFVITSSSSLLYVKDGGTNINDEVVYTRDVLQNYMDDKGTIQVADYTF